MSLFIAAPPRAPARGPAPPLPVRHKYLRSTRSRVNLEYVSVAPSVSWVYMCTRPDQVFAHLLDVSLYRLYALWTIYIWGHRSTQADPLSMCHVACSDDHHVGTASSMIVSSVQVRAQGSNLKPDVDLTPQRRYYAGIRYELSNSCVFHLRRRHIIYVTRDPIKISISRRRSAVIAPRPWTHGSSGPTSETSGNTLWLLVECAAAGDCASAVCRDRPHRGLQPARRTAAEMTVILILPSLQ